MKRIFTITNKHILIYFDTQFLPADLLDFTQGPLGILESDWFNRPRVLADREISRARILGK